jgi:L-2-hydroxyglutarate oxidase LhgO
VIHAGLYYPKGSLKANFCVDGKLSIYEYCTSRSIPVNNCGKLIVATKREQLVDELAKLKDRATSNGVPVELVSANDVNQLEPNVHSFGALWSPTTGIIDSHSFLVSLLADAEHHGATLILHTKVQGGTVEPGNLLLHVDGMDLKCDTLINAAGLWASDIATHLHSSASTSSPTPWKPPRQYFCKGNYFRLQGCSKPPFSRLVYPVPESNGLGVHATIDYSGTSTKFGPDVEWLDVETRPDEIDLVPSAARADVFYDQVRKYWPDLADDALVPDYAGIRPKLNYPGGPYDGFVDFRIDGPSSHNIPGLYHLFGMESPGLTSSIAIGEHIGNLVCGKAFAN